MEYLVTMTTHVPYAAHMRAILDSLPMAPWLTEEITPLTSHPSDPAAPWEQAGHDAATSP